MNNLPDDIIYNICRFLSYPECKVFIDISFSINRMILNSEIHKFNEEYVKITSNFGCTSAFLGCDMIYSKRKRSGRCHMYTMLSIKNSLRHINMGMLCSECYYKYERCEYANMYTFSKRLGFIYSDLKRENLITNDIKITSQKIKN